jgi:hypothetical protein
MWLNNLSSIERATVSGKHRRALGLVRAIAAALLGQERQTIARIQCQRLSKTLNGAISPKLVNRIIATNSLNRRNMTTLTNVSESTQRIMTS